MTDNNPAKWVGAVAILAGVWVGAYWLYEPGAAPIGNEVSFAGEPAGPTDAALVKSVPVTPGPEAAVPRPEPRMDRTLPSADTAGRPGPAPEARPKPAANGPRVVPPEFVLYKVAPNDTFQTIAQKQLGSDKKWGIIAHANPELDPKKLKAGIQIRIPRDESNIQGKVVAGAGGGAGRIAPQGEWAEYTVEAGDSLSRISSKMYGTSKYADAIFEANRSVMDSPDRVKQGQRLRIPPKPGQ